LKLKSALLSRKPLQPSPRRLFTSGSFERHRTIGAQLIIMYPCHNHLESTATRKDCQFIGGVEHDFVRTHGSRSLTLLSSASISLALCYSGEEYLVTLSKIGLHLLLQADDHG
jgi:hypothetical protein